MAKTLEFKRPRPAAARRLGVQIVTLLVCTAIGFQFAHWVANLEAGRVAGGGQELAGQEGLARGEGGGAGVGVGPGHGVAKRGGREEGRRERGWLEAVCVLG